MADYRKLAPKVMKWEGGWADDPNDLGGATMMGITLTTFVSYCKKKNKPVPDKDDLKRITIHQWYEIFKTMYWDRWKGDDIENQSLADLLVDWVWHSGSWGIKIPQRILGVADDGVVGNITLTALNTYPNKQMLFKKIKEAREEYLKGLCQKSVSQKKYLRGWLNRIADFEFAE